MVAQTLLSENKPIITSEKVKIYGKYLYYVWNKKKIVFISFDFLIETNSPDSSTDHDSYTVHI